MKSHSLKNVGNPSFEKERFPNLPQKALTWFAALGAARRHAELAAELPHSRRLFQTVSRAKNAGKLITTALWILSLSLLVSASAVAAQHGDIDIHAGETRTLSFNGLSGLAVGDPLIADVNVFPERPDEAVVNGKKPGVTTLYVWARGADEPAVYRLRVSNQASQLERRAFNLKHYLLSQTEYDRTENKIVVKTDQANVENLNAMLLPILGEKSFSVDLNRNRVLMQGTPGDLAAAEGLLTQIDEPLRQVLIEAKVIEVSKDDLKRLGHSLLAQRNESSLSGDLTEASEVFNLAFDTFTDLARRFKITVDTLRTENVGRTLVNPKIAVQDGKTGWIISGEKVPVATRDKEGLVSYQYVSTGIILAVTPRVGHDRSISLWLMPEVSNISGWVGDPNSSAVNAAPIIDTREIMSEIRVRDGESILLGGLQKDEKIIARAKTPLLGDLPLIGGMFRKKRESTRTSELVIIITPRIIDTVEAPDIDRLLKSEAPAAGESEARQADGEINGKAGGLSWITDN